jgi:hypothetical protein
MEKLTDLDCVMIDSIGFLRKTRKSPGGPSSCGSSSSDVGRCWFDGEDKSGLIQVYMGEIGDKSRPVGDENTVMAEIVARCGEHDLSRRKAAVQQERLYRIWGGREEYYRLFPWLKRGGLPHRDADVVDNACTECGVRGLARGLVRCARCRRGDF